MCSRRTIWIQSCSLIAFECVTICCASSIRDFYFKHINFWCIAVFLKNTKIKVATTYFADLWQKSRREWRSWVVIWAEIETGSEDLAENSNVPMICPSNDRTGLDNMAKNSNLIRVFTGPGRWLGQLAGWIDEMAENTSLPAACCAFPNQSLAVTITHSVSRMYFSYFFRLSQKVPLSPAGPCQILKIFGRFSNGSKHLQNWSQELVINLCYFSAHTN